MAKDAKGHGSDGKGGGGIFNRDSAREFANRIGTSPSHQSGVQAATTGVNLRVQASENPAVGQDYQERTYRYNGSNRKAAVNWALKKAHAEFPNHRSHSVEVME